MTALRRIVLLSAAALVVFDCLAAIAARATGIPYLWASIGSVLAYGGIGYLVARAAPRRPMASAALAGAFLGATDATLGWAASWLLGPGRLVGGLTVSFWATSAASVVVMATVIALLGGTIGRRAK